MHDVGTRCGEAVHRGWCAWKLIAEPNDKEHCFCKRLGIASVEAEAEALVLLAEAVPG